jgi:hypothetical protein
MALRKQLPSRKPIGHKDKRNSATASNMMISVRLPSDLFDRVRESAVGKGQSMSYTIFEAVRDKYMPGVA